MPNRDYTEVDEELRHKLRDVPFQPSTLETIDLAIYNYVDGALNLQSTTNEGWKKVPIIWVSTERAYQIKHDQNLRDQEGTLILPAVTIHRTAVSKDPAKRGGLQPHLLPTTDIKGQTFEIARRINQEKTAEFANAYSDNRMTGNGRVKSKFITRKKNKKVVYEIMSVPIPVWVEISYSIAVRTEYQQQMNELLQPFITRFGNINHFVIKKDGHRYESFVQGEFSMNNNVDSMDAEERRYETKIDVKVLGYLMGEGSNQNQPKIAVRENIVEYRMPRERVMSRDIPRHGGDGTLVTDGNRSVDGGYRE
tara:strand:- start:463 stop:1386 length:924 start_codon:yes stop_codon:yes gene_type:complete